MHSSARGRLKWERLCHLNGKPVKKRALPLKTPTAGLPRFHTPPGEVRITSTHRKHSHTEWQLNHMSKTSRMINSSTTPATGTPLLQDRAPDTIKARNEPLDNNPYTPTSFWNHNQEKMKNPGLSPHQPQLFKKSNPLLVIDDHWNQDHRTAGMKQHSIPAIGEPTQPAQRHLRTFFLQFSLRHINTAVDQANLQIFIVHQPYIVKQ